MVANSQKHSFEFRLFIASLMSGFTIFMIVLLTFNLVINEIFFNTTMGKVLLPISFSIGYGLARYTALAHLLNKQVLPMNLLLKVFLKFWDFSFIIESLNDKEGFEESNVQTIL